MAEEKKRILIVKLSSLGDILHALPAVHCLKNGLNAEIDWVVHPAYEGLARCFPDVRRVLTFPRRGSFSDFSRHARLLREESYDYILDLQGILKSAFVTRLARGKVRVGPSFQREGAFLLYSALAGEKNKNRHAIEEIMDFVRYFGLPEQKAVFPISVPLQLVSEPSPRVALLPFTRWASKTWPLSSFARVGRELREHLNASIYIMGGVQDKPLAAELGRELGGHVIDMTGKTDLPQLAGLLREMNLVIANDSGPMHLAAAMGASVLALYGPTDPTRTGPCPSNFRVLKGKLRCQPCFLAKCRFRDNSCLLTITPEMVINTVVEMLSKNKVRK